MLNDLLLLSGNDIPFAEAQVNIHQPSIKEIAYIGEESFFMGCEILNFSKKVLSEEEQEQLRTFSDLEIFLSILSGPFSQTKQEKTKVLMILTLIFPSYEVIFNKNEIVLKKEEDVKIINENSFPIFQKIIRAMFCLNRDGNEDEYNPQGSMAKSIAKKLEERKRKLAEQSKSANGKINILCRYISILSVGQQKDMNSLLNYTVYQLFDEFHRYELKMQSDTNFQARMAGAQNLPEIEDWMKDIHV